MDGSKPIKAAGIDVPAEERTPLVDHLLRVIEKQRAEIRALRDEIARLKGLPPRPTIRPSTLDAPHPDPQHKRQRRGKRPGSAKRQKTDELMIHETIPVPLEELPKGTHTQQNGYEEFVVQDLKIEAHNVRYGRKTWKTSHPRRSRQSTSILRSKPQQPCRSARQPACLSCPSILQWGIPNNDLAA